MDIVYTNRTPGEKRVHIELTADEVAALVAGSGTTHSSRLRALIAEADRRLNPATEKLAVPIADPDELPMAPGCMDWRRSNGRADLCPMPTCDRCQHLRSL